MSSEPGFHYGWGESQDERLAARAKRTQDVSTGIKIAGAGGSAAMATLAAVGVAVPPWSTAVALGAAATLAATTAIVTAVRKREDKLLAGDKSAIKAFTKQAARWSKAKRERVATRLVKQYKLHKAKAHKKGGFLGLGKKQKQDTSAWLVRESALRMKIETLTALHVAAAKLPKSRPLVDGDASTAAAISDTSALANADLPGDDDVGLLESAPLGIPLWGWALGAVAIGGAAYFGRKGGR